MEGFAAKSTPHPSHVLSLLWKSLARVYDQVFREHVVAICLTDWLCMNVQLFNFHAAGSSIRESSLAQSNEHPERSSESPGSSASAVVCISWNKGRCTAPFTSCRYAHCCSVCSGSHRATACSSRSSKDSRDDGKVFLDRPLVPKLATLESRCLFRQLACAHDVHFLNVVTFCCFMHFSFVTFVTLLFFGFC